MKKEWCVIEVPTRGASVDMVSAVLAEAGSQGTVVEERILDTFIVPDEELEQESDYTLKAYFVESDAPAQILDTVKKELDAIPALHNESLTARLGDAVQIEDWAENWKQNFSTMTIGDRLTIRPSWEGPSLQDGMAVIEIDPGMAFGTGTHGTTRLCLEVVETLLGREDSPASMLDVGTGSGILALGAAALGCSHVLANDIDPDVCHVARDNVKKNGLGSRVTVSDLGLEQLDGSFDLVVANILAEENVRLRAEFLKRLAPGGFLVLSGILKEKEDFVRRSFDPLNLEAVETRYADEWVCLVYHRPG